MASIAEGVGVTDVSHQAEGDGSAGGKFAWLAVGLAAWVIGGSFLVVRALNQGLATDVGLSPYHVVGYAGILALAVLCVALVVRAVRAGRGWQQAFPPAYGTLGAGLLVSLAYIVVDVAWREGVGIRLGIEGGFAPSRILLLVGLVLIAVGPLRSAVLSAASNTARLPAVLSAGLVLALASVPGAFHPAVNPWLESPPDISQDNSEIWLMDADGSHQTRLIEAAEGIEMTLPAWSPDGSAIAFTRWQGVERERNGEVDVWIANADGTGQRALVGGEGMQWLPRWTPDGAFVSYTQEVQGGPWMSTGPVGRDTGFGPLGPGFDAGSAAVRPDADLWRVSVNDTSAPEPITDAPGDDRSGSWSPTGDRVAIDATRDGNTEIYVVNADGSNPVRLTENPAEDWAPAWSPEGTRIAFASDRTGIGQIYVMAADGSNVIQLTDDADNIGPCWSPDGSRIAFQAWRSHEAEIWSMAADGSDERNLSRSASSTESVWDGSWGPDGRIVFSRAQNPPASADSLVREDLEVASLLIQAAVLAVMAIILVSIRPPFGSFGLVMGIATALAASEDDQWRFVPAAILGGLLVDLLVRLAPGYRKTLVAAVSAPVVLVLGFAATVLTTTGIAWTPTLVLGVAFAGALIGWALTGIVRPRPATAETSPPR
jgi:Tol biopolymer transport system component